MKPGNQAAVRPILLGAALAAIMLALWRPSLGDYSRTLRGNPDNAGAAIWALAHGHFGRLPDAQPLMGAASLILRAPLAAIGDAFGGVRLEYWLGALGCLTTLAVLAVALGSEVRRRGMLLGGAAVVALLLGNPATTQSISAGHPEELLLASAATAAVWAAARGRATASGALTGVAIGTLPFGAASLLATGLATRARRVGVVVTAVIVGLLLVLPLPLTAPHTYLDRSRQLAHLRRVYPQSAWWWVGNERTLQVNSGGSRPEHQAVRFLPGGLDRGSGLLVAAALALAVTALVAVRRRGRALGYDALAVLALLFILRSAFDPQNLEYYVAPGIVALVAWEVLARRRLPVASAVAVALDAIVFHSLNGHDTQQAIGYSLWFAGVGGYLLTAPLRRAE